MKAYIFSVIMNIVAAVILFGEGATAMNNLGTSIPAILCIVAAIFAAIQIKKSRNDK